MHGARKGVGLSARITRFSIVGIINTLVDVGVLNVLVILLHFHYTFSVFGFKIVSANLISVSAAIINSYLMNKYWTFERRGRREIPAEALIFVIISLIGMVINTAVLSLLYHHWTWPAETVLALIRNLEIFVAVSDNFFLLNLSKALALAASMIWNFLAYNHWAFPDGRKSGDDKGTNQ
ncbi:GtrA family protein [Acidobacteriota bacterium]